MTKKQKKIVTSWIAVALTLVLLSIFDVWVRENWDAIKWPLIIVLILTIDLSRKSYTTSVSQGRRNINEIVDQYPWIKGYMVIYCILVVVTFYKGISNNFEFTESLGIAELTIAILGIMLPVFIVQEIQRYKDAGKKK